MLPALSAVFRAICVLSLLLLASARAYTAADPFTLSWDGGETETGLTAVPQPTNAAGQYYFRLGVHTGAVWRTRLTVTAGEANLYLAKGSIPVPGAAGTRTGALVGSDGILLASPDFAAGETWYLMVEATGANNAWSLVSGDPYIQDLGNLPFTDTNADGTYNIGEPVQNGGIADKVMGPEGVSFFKVTLPPNVPAWALWMNGGQQLLGVRKNQVPVLFKTAPVADRKRDGSLLLVPPYLGQGSDSYYVSVVATAGSTYSLDSRIQEINDIPFEGTVPGINASASPYRVYRVEVPAQQVIWDLSLESLMGDPNICVRKQTVPAETDNDALSEAVGTVDDSVTLVSPVLTNGTWFITLFSDAPYQANLKSGTPEITDIGYRSEVTNDQPERSGWRYYRVPDISSQLGTLGWQLDLDDAPPGTEIAIRRNLAPGTWKQKTNGSATATSVRYSDFSSSNGILQRVDHEADIWYVGVYQPETALGNYKLKLTDIVSASGSFDGYDTAVTGQIEGEWRYFRIIVPSDPTLLGWYVDLYGVEGDTTAKITIRRDRLPPAPTGSPSVSAASAAWPSGAAWSQTNDFSGIMQDFDGKNVAGHHFLAAIGPGRPLQAGTYYVGVLAGSGQPAIPKTISYHLRSRGIGGTHAIPVTPLNYTAGTANVTELAPRDFRFFSLTIPPDAQVPSWDLKLAQTAGEMHLQVRRDSLPDFSTSASVGEGSGVLGGKRTKKTGGERLTLLPEQGQAYLQTGTYYAAVISEGTLPGTALGENPSSGTLSSVSPTPVTDLGTITTTATDTPFDLPGGELAVYRVTVPAGSGLLEAYITGRSGNPGISMVKGTALPKPFPGNTTANNGYGWVGGQTAATHPVLLTMHAPEAGVYTLVVRANAETNGTFPNGAGTLHFRVVNEFPEVGALVNNTATVTDQIAEGWRYFRLTVPDNAAIQGIQVRLRNVTSGLPRMVIRKGTGLPKDFNSTANLNSDSPSWPDGAQWYQASDFSGMSKDSTGGVVSGRSFLCAYNTPMGPGVYTIGVSKDASINTTSSPNTPNMNYTLRVDCIGAGMNYEVTTIAANNTASPEVITELPERELRFFKVTIPEGMASWRMKLSGSLTGDTPPLVRDGMMTIRKDRIPAHDVGTGPAEAGGTTVKILNQGDPWIMLPSTDSGVIEGGDYYIAVTSLGAKPSAGQSGTATSDLTLTTRGELPLEVLPPLSVDVSTEVPYALEAAEVSAYEFTVPSRAEGLTPYGFVISLGRGTGKSNFSARLSGPDGDTSPTPPGLGLDGFYGGLSPQLSTNDAITGQIVYQGTPGTYRVIVRSTANGTNYTSSTGMLRVQLLDSSSGIPTVDFDGGSLTVTAGGATTDILAFRVVVPDDPNWKAWGVRLAGFHSGKPSITIRRDQPVGSGSAPSVDSESTDWPTLAQWAQLEDFTKLKLDPASSPWPDKDRTQQYFVAARDRPMKPGTYYIGIDNRGTSLISPRTFTIRTFAFGEGYTVPVSDLSTVGSSTAISIEDPRMPSVHKITIPPGARSWAVALNNTLGDLTLRVRRGFVPDTVSAAYTDLKGGIHLQKAGDERFTLLPKPGEDFLSAGDYYFVAVSEGQNSLLGPQTIGTGAAAATLTNLGPLAIQALGTVSESGLAQAVSLEPAEVKFFTVDVPAGINNLQFRLNDRSGEASIAVLKGMRLPAPALSESYGVVGGQTDAANLKKDKAIVNLGNPAAGIYTIAVRAGGTPPSSYAPASATLAIDILKPAPLNFSERLNAGNGFSNTDARSLADKQKYFYRVAIPPQIEGEDVLGWLVTIEQGSPVVKIYQSEAGFGTTPPVAMVGRTALVVPPLLTFGTNWFIEVEGVGTTDYIIRSERVALSTAPWTLPGTFNAHAGDSNPGAPEGVGVGRELSQDHWDFYALDVAEENPGLMRFVLEASNGNPNVYIRLGGIPTMDHKSTGTGGSILYQHKMISEDSETGNFSEPSDTVLQPDRLKSGRWYIGVKSDPVGLARTSSRYRLRAHSGVVTNLDLNSPVPLTNQNLAEKDWRYYRVTIPRTGVPANWLPTFTRLHGTAQLYIRDTLPPFSYVKNTATTPGAVTYIDWGSDAKNNVASGTYVKTPAPGSVSLPVPPLRPGKTYYMGFYGSTGGAFEVSSAVSTPQLAIDAELAYDTGSATFTIPANGKKLLRFHVPADATRVKFNCVQSAAGVLVKLEQGAPPDATAGVTAHLQSGGTYPASFVANKPVLASWPFVANQDYYVLLTNMTGAAIDSTITMKGVNALTEDEDVDGVPDFWERLYFAAHTTYPATADPDGDGSNNLQEYTNGTIPNNAGSVFYTVAVTAPGGTFSVSPQMALYPKNTQVTLTAIPGSGDSFRRWSSPGTPIDGSTTPTLVLPLTASINAKAIFTSQLGMALDTPESQAWTTSGNGAWFGQYESSHDGQDAASSPPLGGNANAVLSTVLTGPGTLGFRWRVSSRPNTHYLTLLLDGVAQPGAISGTTMTGWDQVSLAIPAGSHTVSWRYAKNGTTGQGEDRGWVDRVTYTGFPSQAPSYAAWTEASFTVGEQANPQISGANADPDRDGIPNVLEAALGMAPKTKDTEPPLKFVSAVRAGSARTIRLESKVAASGISNVALRLEVANGLGGWTTLTAKTGDGDWSSQPTTTTTETTTGASRDPVAFEETIPATGSDKRFYRLAAEMVP